MINQIIQKSIEEASQVIGKTWPLHAFVTSNPLSGYEQKSFKEATKQAEKLLNAKVFPEAAIFSEALQKKYIDRKELIALLKENQLLDTPEEYLEQMALYKKNAKINNHNVLDNITAKWLAAFMDEGLAEWEMPNRQEGFYKAWRKLAIYDNEMPKTTIADIPKTSNEALEIVLKDYEEEDYIKIFTFHLAALPGWTGYINYRISSQSKWQEEYPISLNDYLAVRLWIAKKIKASIFPKNEGITTPSSISKIQYIWLKAWEKSWQNELKLLLDGQQTSLQDSDDETTNSLEAQMVFCIDTRSELIRRHIENKGQYETFGYAGFFGIAMDYEDMNNGLTKKSCPPIVNSAYHVSEKPKANHSEKVIKYKQHKETLKFKDYFLKRMKNMLPSAFGYVEGSGLFYGISLTARTLLPSQLYKVNKEQTTTHETLCEPEIKKTCNTDHLDIDIPLAEKVSIVKSAFDLMGWQKFAPIVLFVGHGSHSANNPFGSSLDCGACAASPGRHNARMLAKLANLKEVRKALKDHHHFNIPDNTIFIGSEHNTTTDEIVLFDSEVPASHKNELQNLKIDLKKAQETATQERLGIANNSVKFAHKKANNWGETRPEWGLAKNAGFIVGPRSLTQNHNLGGRCFLHSYNWESDKTGKALEGIMQGAMVVTQWINNHYYFSTVDNNVFGGGTKITHNITGKFGVVQGNGGDIKMGLPLQSLMQSDSEMHHQPLRLSVVIHAPLDRVINILERNEKIKSLLDNEWIYLMIMDPLTDNTIYTYSKNMNWKTANKKASKKEAKKSIIVESEVEVTM